MGQTAWIMILILPAVWATIKDKLLNLSKPQFSLIKNTDDNYILVKIEWTNSEFFQGSWIGLEQPCVQRDTTRISSLLTLHCVRQFWSLTDTY